MTSDLPRPTWPEFQAMFEGAWKPGQHVFIYGETNSGKTDLAFRLLNMSHFGVAFVTKPRDPIFKSALTRGYRRVNSWPPKQVDKYRNSHFLLSAKAGKSMSEELSNQQDLFPDAFERIYRDGGWTVQFDETLHIGEALRMGDKLSQFAYLARSYDLTGIYCSQRPKRIPVIIPQSCKYAFIARVRRDEDLRTLSELGYSKVELQRQLQMLRQEHDFLFVDPQGDLPLMIVNTHKMR